MSVQKRGKPILKKYLHTYASFYCVCISDSTRSRYFFVRVYFPVRSTQLKRDNSGGGVPKRVLGLYVNGGRQP